MNYNPAIGRWADSLSQILGDDPESLIKEDLRRFKQLMETGEIATIKGQSSGREEAGVTNGQVKVEQIDPTARSTKTEVASGGER